MLSEDMKSLMSWVFDPDAPEQWRDSLIAKEVGVTQCMTGL